MNDTAKPGQGETGFQGPQLRLAVIGPGSSGREQTLLHLIPEATEGFGPHEFSWQLGLAQLPIKIKTLGYLFGDQTFTTVAHALEDPKAAQDLEFLWDCHGVLFLIDSRDSHRDANYAAYELLHEAFDFKDKNKLHFPVSFELNMQDQERLTQTRVLKDLFHWPLATWVEAVAREGVGVNEAFESLLSLILKENPDWG